MSQDGSIIIYAEQVLGIKLMPWQKEVLLRFERLPSFVDPLANVRQVAAKYCPAPNQHADARSMLRMLDLGR